MNHTDSDFVMAFDHFYTTNHIQIIKSLLPFLGPDLALIVPVFVKYLELKYTLSLMNQHKSLQPSCDCQQTRITSLDKITPELLEQIYQAVHCYLTPAEDQKIQSIRNILQAISSFKEMQQMMELMKALNPEENGDCNTNGMDFLSGMMGTSFSADTMNTFTNILNNLKL